MKQLDFDTIWLLDDLNKAKLTASTYGWRKFDKLAAVKFGVCERTIRSRRKLLGKQYIKHLPNMAIKQKVASHPKGIYNRMKSLKKQGYSFKWVNAL